MQRYADWELAIKKTLQHPKANEKVRIQFQEKIKKHKAKGRKIIYLDESGFALDMPRTHGYTQKGKRCYGSHDWHARGRLNVIGAINNHDLLTIGLFDGSINADVFHAWLTQDLLPKLNANSVIVMDNASFHKRADIINTIKSHKCILEFLPPYSPDLNPIEKKWAQAKSIRKKFRCSVYQLFAKHFDYAFYKGFALVVKYES